MSSGWRCGYVFVPPGHPWHGEAYGDIVVEVRGGLCYSGVTKETDLTYLNWWAIGFPRMRNMDTTAAEITDECKYLAEQAQNARGGDL